MASPAARFTDVHICPAGGGPLLPPTQTTVMIGNQFAARVTDLAMDFETPDAIVKGSLSVKIVGLPAARLGDSTTAGGKISTGFPTVWIGDKVGSGSGFCLKCAAAQAAAFVKGM